MSSSRSSATCAVCTPSSAPDVLRNTPICEATLTGMAVGLAAAGDRPVLHMMFANFLFTGMDAIANQMAKLRLMTGGQMELPITIVASYGAGRSSAAQHSDTPYPVLMNLGGINVLTPANAADAKGLLKTAIRDRNPCVFLEPSGRGGDFGEVPDGDHLVSFGSVSIMREGNDVTVVAIGRMVKLALTSAELLAGDGLDVEVIDPRTLVPFDSESVLSSVAKTGRLVIVDEARECCSAASQIAAVVAERGFDLLEAPSACDDRQCGDPVRAERRGARAARPVADRGRGARRVRSARQGGELTCASRSPCPTSG